MATYSYGGTNYTLKATPLVGTYPYAGDFYNAQLYCLSDEVYFGTACDLGSIFTVGKLPAGAVVQFVVVWPTTAAVFGAPTTLSDATTFKIGVTADSVATAADDDLFGAITAMNASAAVQFIAPIPDGTTYTTTLDMALRGSVDIQILSAAANGTATEGLVVKIFYTLGGRTYK